MLVLLWACLRPRRHIFLKPLFLCFSLLVPQTYLLWILGTNFLHLSHLQPPGHRCFYLLGWPKSSFLEVWAELWPASGISRHLNAESVQSRSRVHWGQTFLFFLSCHAPAQNAQTCKCFDQTTLTIWCRRQESRICLTHQLVSLTCNF